MPKIDWITAIAILAGGSGFLVASVLVAGLAGFLN